MKDVWDKIIEEPEKVRFVQAVPYSPYLEGFNGCIKEDNGTYRIETNAFYRYDDIAWPLFASNLSDEKKLVLFDVFMHLATRLELKRGLSKKEHNVRLISYQIENGEYGNKAEKLFAQLDVDAKYLISHAVVLQNEIYESVHFFSNILMQLLGDGVIYKNTVNDKELLLYLSKKPSKDDWNKIEIAKELFLPIGNGLRVYETDSFGVVGHDMSMSVNDIVLF